MSEFSDQMDDGLVICPYCEYEYQREAEDYDEDERAEECGRCEKKFYAHDSFTVTQHTRPDCELNGEKHDWSVVANPEFVHCDTCGKCEYSAVAVPR